MWGPKLEQQKLQLNFHKWRLEHITSMLGDLLERIWCTGCYCIWSTLRMCLFTPSPLVYMAKLKSVNTEQHLILCVWTVTQQSKGLQCTDKVFWDMLFNGITDSDICCKTLTVDRMQVKPISKVFALVKSREIAHNANPLLLSLSVTSTYQQLCQQYCCANEWGITLDSWWYQDSCCLLCRNVWRLKGIRAYFRKKKRLGIRYFNKNALFEKKNIFHNMNETYQK